MGSKQKLKDFLLKNIGRVLKTSELQKAAGGAGQYTRRIRELREDEGWKILTRYDCKNLKPDEYILTEEPPKEQSRKSSPISARLRAVVLDRDGSTCQMCGATVGDDDDLNPGRKIRLHVGHIKDRSLGGRDELANLRALCSNCNQGAKNVTQEKPSKIWLSAQVRRADIEAQRSIFESLKKKFEGNK